MEDRLARILEVGLCATASSFELTLHQLLSGHSHYASEKTGDARAYAEEKKGSAWHWCSQKGDEAKGKGGDYAECVKSKAQEKGFGEKAKGAGESIKWGGEKVKSAGDEL